jgi:hypothetical protein
VLTKKWFCHLVLIRIGRLSSIYLIYISEQLFRA